MPSRDIWVWADKWEVTEYETLVRDESGVPHTLIQEGTLACFPKCHRTRLPLLSWAPGGLSLVYSATEALPSSQDMA